MFRLVTVVSSELSAIAFAIYLGFFLFQSPGYTAGYAIIDLWRGLLPLSEFK